jgi:hypothetical protein
MQYVFGRSEDVYASRVHTAVGLRRASWRRRGAKMQKIHFVYKVAQVGKKQMSRAWCLLPLPMDLRTLAAMPVPSPIRPSMICG